MAAHSLTPSQDGSYDIEKTGASATHSPQIEAGEVLETSMWKRLMSSGMEMRGAEPVPVEERTETRGFSIFTLWWSISLTLLALVFM
jgi:hypothetical protein